MTGGFGRSGVRRTFAFCSLAAISGGGASLAGCLGAGDESIPVLPVADAAADAADGKATEGGAGDAHPDAVTAIDGWLPEGSAGDAPADGAHDATATDAGSDATLQDGGDGAISVTLGGPPRVQFSASVIDFGLVPCSGNQNRTLIVSNIGQGQLSVSATTVGTPFAVMPPSFDVAPGTSQTVTLTAKVPDSASAGVALQGSLNVITTDPAAHTVALPLSVTPQGARLDFVQAAEGSVIAFPTTRIGSTSTIDVAVQNYGNAPIDVVGTKSPLFAGTPEYSLVTVIPDAGVEIAPSQVWTFTLGYKPTSAPTPDGGGMASLGTMTLATSGATCGTSLTDIRVAGAPTNAMLSGFPAVDPGVGKPALTFGPTTCGQSPGTQPIVLVNNGAVPATITAALDVDDGFSTNITGANSRTVTIPPAGSFSILVSAPPFPKQDSNTAPGEMPAPRTANLTISSPDSTPTSTVVVLRDLPSGVSLAWDEPTPVGSFGTPSVLLQSQQQTFNVVNKGSADSPAASVTLNVATTVGAPLGGADGGGPPPFGVSTPTFALAAGSTAQAETLTFTPVVAGPSQGTLSLTVDPSTPLCARLPDPIPLSGAGIGAGPDVSPMALAFDVPCDGNAVTSTQFFTVSNVAVSGGAAASRDMNWQMGPITGPGAANYTIVNVSKAPGLLHPGESSIVTIGVSNTIPPAVPLPDGGAAPVAPTPAELAAQIAITTDVPYYDPVVRLNELPIGDQLAVSTGNLGFSEIPVGQQATRTFTVTNSAPNGNAAANVSFTVTGAGYSAPVALSLGAGSSQSASIGFAPTLPSSYLGTVELATQDPLCAPLPQPIVLQGTGTQGAAVFSQSNIDFGAIACGAAAQAASFTVANQGNQPFSITGAALASGAYYTLGDAAGNPLNLPMVLDIGSPPTTIRVTPKPMPQTASPGDATPFADTVTITTDITPGDTHTVALAMRPVGSVISFPLDINPSPWDFGTIGFGSIASLVTPVRNDGNSPATMAIAGLVQPSIFLLGNATLAPASTTSLLGEFAPPQSNGSWSDTGTLTVTASQAFCSDPPSGWAVDAMNPAQWDGPVIDFLGSSSSSQPVAVTGSLAFGATECGAAPPAPQANGAGTLTLTNLTNQPLPFVVSLQRGTHYTVTTANDAGLSTGDAGTGLLPANGVAVVTVTPQPVTPGPGVLPGSTPYADSVVISVGSSSPPIWSSTFPVSWQLDGAVLSLATPAGDHTAAGVPYYVADSTAGHTVPITNSGTETATVDFIIPASPSGANFTVQPSPPTAVSPGPSTLVHLLAATSAPACASATPGPNTTLTVVATGHVCQPLPSATANVEACSGSLN